MIGAEYSLGAVRTVIPPCPHRPTCPGCPRYGEPGIDASAAARLAALAARAGLTPPRVATGAPLGFRTRARLAVRGRAASPKVGIFQTGSHRIADIPRCGIHHPAVNEVAAALRGAIRATGVEPYADRPRRGVLRYLQVAVERTSGRAQVVLVGNSDSHAPLAPVFAALERELGERLQGLFWNGNTAPGNAILGPRWERIAGGEALRESVAGVDVFHPPGAFGQSHPELFESLAERARAAVPDGARVLELYAGAGAIGLGLLARAASVELNELSPHALRGLELGIAARPEPERARASILAGDAAAHAERIARADVVVVDPPRRGLDRAVLEALVATPPTALVYVSCGLDSLARDAAQLLDSGRHALAGLEAWALFPYTPHVETLAIFRRRSDAPAV
jgi:tRNA/tmRNA/rRNA uracil-C5-methylase (TrmA/RlmC/RlmD family)